ncbi:MAG TPA: serine hydrolase domain-containing protein [Pseudonocardia sp.]|jgi:CubicO group peptidase (beta-lactamase class C family)
MLIDGCCAPGFAEVRAEFTRNFTDRGDIGAALCVRVDGAVVVDLWGGTADPGTGRAWEADTPVMVWSATKAATALCAHLLADRGALSLDDQLVRFWPEFAGAGRDAITVGMVLSHQAGLPHLRQRLPRDAYLDPEAMAERLTTEPPFWAPGTRHGYHAATFGWLLGEVVRRTTGQSIGEFFAGEIAGPQGLDFWIGLPATRDAAVAPCIRAAPPPPGTPLPANMDLAMRDPESIPALIFGNTGGYFSASNTPPAWRAQIPAINGIASARGLAGLYAALPGIGGSLVGEGTVAAMSSVRSAGFDQSLRLPTRFAAGFQKTWDNRAEPLPRRHNLVMSESAFGHVGFGGCVGLGDPAAGLALGYTLNRHGTSIVADERGQALIDATYRALGWRGGDRCCWYRSAGQP